MTPSPSTKAWWGRVGLIIFIMGITTAMSYRPDTSTEFALPFLLTIVGGTLAICLGWSKADHQ